MEVLVSVSHRKCIIQLTNPGITHDYLLPLSDLAASGERAVILYDQLGNGKSTRLRERAGDEDFWSLDLFIDELINLVAQLGLKSFDLIGHSWGSMLAIEYLIRRRPTGVRRFLSIRGPATVPFYLAAFERYLKAFPKEVQEGIMQKADVKRFRAAQDTYDAVHTCAVQPFPKEFVYSMDSVWGPDADDTVDKIMSAFTLLL
jgi:proline-specific peptidase